jgi:hypothetical protein
VGYIQVIISFAESGVNNWSTTKEIKMLSFLKKFFGAKPTVSPCPDVPYKVETPKTTVGTVPMSTQYANKATEAVVKSVAKKPAGAKKPAAQAKTARAKKK